MTKPVQPAKNNFQSTDAMRSWHMELILALVALAIVYLAGVLAIDTGSLLAYGVAVLFFVLAVRHVVRAGISLKKGRHNGSER